ncbi:MAG: 30S ribosomal protein S10 [Candidatus Nanohaloarchaeota archaeon QJJ-7]|nr:30S ribosomal protein S10 [Candidatus Nanohaloarchaeota archaeon QJJ-7]
MQKARVKLSSTESEKVDNVADDVIETADNYNAKVSGPVPLPTDIMEVPVMKTPDGEGKATWERWEMRVHKRLIDVSDSERALRQIMRVHVPEGVSIEVEIME